MFKSLLAAAALAAVAFTASAPAEAKTNVDVYLGFGGFNPGYYGYYRPHYPRHRPHYRPVYVQPNWGISCGQGSNKVDRSGFNNVRAVECQGSSYTYRATRHGKGYVVKVARRGGDIISVNRAW